MLNRGFDLRKDTNYQLVFERPITDIFTAALFGSQYDHTPNARITATQAASPKSVRVIVDLAVVTNPGSAFERRTPQTTLETRSSIKAYSTIREGRSRCSAAPLAAERGRRFSLRHIRVVRTVGGYGMSIVRGWKDTTFVIMTHSGNRIVEGFSPPASECPTVIRLLVPR